MKAKDVKVGDFITLDVGYGGHIDYVQCEVLEVLSGKNLWDMDVIWFKVGNPSTGVFFTHNFYPDDSV